MVNKERLIIIGVLFVLGFFATNFNQTLAFTFFIFIVAYALNLLFDTKISFPFVRQNNDYTKSFIIALSIWIGFVFLSQFVTKSLSFFDTVKFLSTQVFAQTLAFENNPILIFLAYALIIPFSESLSFFGTLLEIAVDTLKIKSRSLTDTGAIASILIVGVLFSIFHITARIGPGIGGQFNTSLFIVFLFGAISSAMVIYTGQLLEAVLFHMIANSVALFNIILQNIQTLTIILIAIASVGAFTFIIKRIDLRRLLNGNRA